MSLTETHRKINFLLPVEVHYSCVLRHGGEGSMGIKRLPHCNIRCCLRTNKKIICLNITEDVIVKVGIQSFALEVIWITCLS